MAKVSQKKIGRLSLYRRLLTETFESGQRNLYSHELAKLANASAAQVRRDLMAIGYKGNPAKGYDVEELIRSLASFLDASDTQNVALVGVGHLGLAILSYFRQRRPKLRIVAAFDNDPKKINRTIHDCPIYPVNDYTRIIQAMNIEVAIVAVPAPFAQEAGEKLQQAGITGILNFAPTPIQISKDVFVENIDMTMSLEKVAYFARQNNELDLTMDEEDASQSYMGPAIELD